MRNTVSSNFVPLFYFNSSRRHVNCISKNLTSALTTSQSFEECNSDTFKADCFFLTLLILNGLFRRSPLCFHNKKQICLILLFTLISIQFRADLQFHLDEGQSIYISSVTSSTIHVTIMVTIDSNFISFFQKVEYLFLMCTSRMF